MAKTQVTTDFVVRLIGAKEVEHAAECEQYRKQIVDLTNENKRLKAANADLNKLIDAGEQPIPAVSRNGSH